MSTFRLYLASSLLLAGLFLSCSDPTNPNIPPPEELTQAQKREVQPHLLAQLPDHPLTFPRDVTLHGESVRYLGTDVLLKGQRLTAPTHSKGKITLPAGVPFTLRHYFRSEKPVDANWKLFFHGATVPQHPKKASKQLINGDHDPVHRLWPTKKWQVGQIIEDEHTIVLPEHEEISLRFYLGFFRIDGQRMHVDQRAHHDGRHRIPIGQILLSGSMRPLPTYVASKRQSPIVIDGHLTDEAWKGAVSTGFFGRSYDGKKPRTQTEAKLLWDESALYVAFRVQDDDVWGSLKNHDDPIYQEEVVEVFLDADGNGKTYNELELSPHNVVFDAYFPARRQNMTLDWNAHMETAVQIQGTLDDPTDKDTGWTAEMRIPIEHLADVPHWPPRETDQWRFNLYRLDWHSNRKINEGQAFSPLFMGDFHHLPRFGILKFSGMDSAKTIPTDHSK